MNVGDKIRDTRGTEYLALKVYRSGGQGDTFLVRRTSGDTEEPLVVKIYKTSEPDRHQRLTKIISQAPAICSGFPDKTFCFPTRIIQDGDIEGVVMPHAVGVEMSELIEAPGNCPHSPKAWLHFKKGQYKKFLLNAFHLARAVDKLYRNGFTHCDLSRGNVFIDTSTGQVSIIDLDNLAVEGFLPAKVLGTEGYTAPELVTGRVTQPNHKTDAHSLAVLVFNLLMFRHPLVGSQMNTEYADDPFGGKAVYTDHPQNRANRFTGGGLRVSDIPQDIQDLFHRAFVKGLQDSMQRPTATAWIRPLWRAVESLYVCEKCKQTSFFNERNSRECFFGHKNQRPFAKLLFKTGTVKVVQAGTVLYPHHFNVRNSEYDLSERLGDFKPHGGSDLVFANRSTYVLEVLFSRSSTRKTLSNQQGVLMSRTKRIYFLNEQYADVEFLG
jgi:DNA-binding helix-hairpin-helix protein with protein kinase domain